MANLPSVFKNTIILPLFVRYVYMMKINEISIEYPFKAYSINELAMKGAYYLL